MLPVPKGIIGHSELETKILGIDPFVVAEGLQKLGATSEGPCVVVEQRYVATQTMEKNQCSARLRKISSATWHVVELVLKQKHPHESIPGYEHLGPLLKRRTEYEVLLENSTTQECRFAVMRTMMQAYEMTERDRLVTQRTRFTLGKTHFDLETIIQYNNTRRRLPPPFMEIEAPDPQSIVEAAANIGYRPEDFCPLPKRKVIAAYRKSKVS